MKSTTEEEDNNDSTTGTMVADQTNNNVEVTTVIADEVQPQNTKIEDTTKGTTVVVQTDIIDGTPKIIIEDDTTVNVDRTTKVEDVQPDKDDRTPEVEDVQTDNVMRTTIMIDKSPTKYKEGIDKGTQTNSVMESTRENLYQSTASPKRPHSRSHNRQIVTEVTKQDSDIKNENEQRDDNNSPGNNSSEINFSTLFDQQPQLSSETIRDLDTDIQKTTHAVEEDQSVAAKDILTYHQSSTPDAGNTPDGKTPTMISRILNGPKQLEDDKFLQISDSFKTFLIDFVNIISSDLMEKLSRKGSTIQFKSDKEYPAPSGDYGSTVLSGYDEGSGTETTLSQEDYNSLFQDGAYYNSKFG